ncbi:hypothetical protein QQF64_007905 [Cirrhinus molitorella]|uniref:Anoctamin dimerisation domain-containing protein n=1 Tax=Cirrhinus molitorella TaxID=172907 RepID=A0ABR3M4N4_9TELE
MKRKKNLVEDSATLIALSDHPDQTYGSMEACAAAQENKNVFSDGVTRIDFVLEVEDRVSFQTPTAGLHQETKEVMQGKTKTTYILLSAPWNVLCYYAEEISLRVPLQVVTTPISNWSEGS